MARWRLFSTSVDGTKIAYPKYPDLWIYDILNEDKVRLNNILAQKFSTDIACPIELPLPQNNPLGHIIFRQATAHQ